MSRGFFAVGVYHPKNGVNIGTLWRTADIMGAAFVFTVGRRYKEQASDTRKTPRHTPLFHFADVEDLRAHLPESCILVGVELADRAQNIRAFSHPERACYLLGAEDNGIPELVQGRCHRLLKLDGEESMNVSVAGSIVVYHRSLQRVLAHA
jgi:tRNA G18 (ribose-2'-O)-methylase SpoU